MKSFFCPKRLVNLARLFLIAILMERLWPYLHLATVADSWKEYFLLVDYQGAHLAVVTMIVLLFVLRWSKTVVATVSAMFAIAGLHDTVVYGIDLSKRYQLNDLFWGSCFAISATLLAAAIYQERHAKGGEHNAS